MGNLVTAPTASHRCRPVLFPILLSGLLLSPGPSRAAPLAFRWGVPCRVGVTTISQKDSVVIVGHEVVHLFSTPNPAELKLSSEDTQLWDLHSGPSRLSSTQSALSQAAGLFAAQPPTTLTRDGDFVRAQVSEEFLSALGELVRKLAGPLADSMAMNRVEAALRSPETQARMQSEEADKWNAWAGAWVDLDLRDGTSAAARIPTPWAGTSIESDIVVENLGPTGPGGRLLAFALTSRTQGEEARRTFEAYMRAKVSEAGGTLPGGPLLNGVTRTVWNTIVLDPATMRPNYARSAMLLELDDSTGTSRKFQSDSYFFEWNPPLAAVSVHDVIPPSGLEAFFANRLPEAYDTLRTAVENGTRNADTYTYLAETCRRLDLLGQGALFARRALELAPSHAFAHQVLAACYSDQFSGWPLTSADSTWSHLLQSVACDSTDGNTWLSVSIESRRRNRSDLEQRSLLKLVDTGFLTRRVLAYGRWMLQDLPESTLLVTNGDMDSYPLWSLQLKERLRPDVAVVNYSLLNTPWYSRSVRDRMGIPLPFADADLDSLKPLFTDSTRVLVSHQILRGWLKQRESGTLRRPLAVAITVPGQDLPAGLEDGATLIGPALLCGSRASGAWVDTAAVRASLGHVRAEEFVGRSYSDRDRSPIRRNASPLSDNIVEVWIQYGDALGRAGLRRQAWDTLRKASDFAGKTGATPTLREQIQAMQASYRP